MFNYLATDDVQDEAPSSVELAVDADVPLSTLQATASLDRWHKLFVAERLVLTNCSAAVPSFQHNRPKFLAAMSLMQWCHTEGVISKISTETCWYRLSVNERTASCSVDIRNSDSDNSNNWLADTNSSSVTISDKSSTFSTPQLALFSTSWHLSGRKQRSIVNIIQIKHFWSPCTCWFCYYKERSTSVSTGVLPDLNINGSCWFSFYPTGSRPPGLSAFSLDLSYRANAASALHRLAVHFQFSI